MFYNVVKARYSSSEEALIEDTNNIDRIWEYWKSS
jgi:hypothetical protein